MRTGFLLVIFALVPRVALQGPADCAAQEGAFAFQVRGGVGVPVGDFRSGEGNWAGRAEAGPAMTMGFTLPFPGPLGAYLGFGQYRFGCGEAVCRPGKEWVSTGFDGGLRFVLGERRVRPWVQAGVHTARVEASLAIDSDGGKRISDRGVGVEVGGGLLVAVGRRTSLNTGVRYGRLDADFSKVGTLGMRYLGVDLGLALGF